MDLAGGLRRTHWQQSVPIASWLFALGVARFSVHHYDVVRGIPQQVWVFPQDRDKGYALFELTGRRAFEFFSDQVGPYAYEKLAHVEAAGVSGGMEQATSIFYGEKNVAGGRAPVVHEVAHQWFGNAVTEKDWDDVWLSEGFATYFTHLYAEQFSGRDEFVRGLKTDVATIVAGAAQGARPADHPPQHRGHGHRAEPVRVPESRLGAAHASRDDGDREVLDGNSRVLPAVPEPQRVDRRFPPGDGAGRGDGPVVVLRPVAAAARHARAEGRLALRPGRAADTDRARTDTGGPAFRMPIEVGISGPKGPLRIERVELLQASGQFTIPADSEPTSVVLDPNTWVLMETPEFRKQQ